MTTRLPIVDVSRWSGDGRALDRDVAIEVDLACRQIGAILVTGHGIDQDLIASIDAVTRDFFHRPLAQKLAASSGDPAVRRGYRPSGVALAKSLGVDTPPDLVEAFSINNPEHEMRPDVVAADFAPYFAANIWPDEPAGFRSTWEAYYATLSDLTDRMLAIFARALDLPIGWFDDKFDHHYSGLLANFYPRQTEPPLPGQIRRGAHSDYGAFTLLYQDDAPGGLEVLDADGHWVGVECVPDTFVFNIGDLMSAWTNDRWLSPIHRVVNPPSDVADTERLSIPFFVNPNVDALVECLPTCLPDGATPTHRTVHAGDWVVGKIRRSVTTG